MSGLLTSSSEVSPLPTPLDAPTAMPRAQTYFSQSQSLTPGYLVTPSMTTKSVPDLAHEVVVDDEAAGF